MRRILFWILFGAILTSSLKIPGIVRLHVVANSNTQKDQQVKLEVRDAVLELLGDMNGAKTPAQTLRFINENTAKIKETAQKVLKANNLKYSVKVMTGVYEFPSKTYGNLKLPAGNYDALKIVLGSGKGDNWWCVLFPPLCLVEPVEVKEGWKQQDGVVYQSLLGSLFSGK